MATNQQLLSESRALVNQIINEHNTDRYLELIEAFIEKYEIWPSLIEVITSLAPTRISDKKNLFILEQKALKEIQSAYCQLIKKSKTKKINIPQSITGAYEQKTLSSAGYTTNRFNAVRDLLLFLQDQGQTPLVKKYAIISPTGSIYECTFSPSYIKWYQEKEATKKSAWYSFDQIIFLKNNTSNLLFIEDYPLGADDHYMVTQKLHALMLSSDPRETMSQYNSCVKILHDYTKSILLGREKKPDSYDKKTGILIRNGEEIKFKPAQLRGKVLALLHPRGKQRTTVAHFDEIYYKAIRSEADALWDNLDNATREKIKKQIFEAYEGINERVSKKTNKPYLSAEDLTLHFV